MDRGVMSSSLLNEQRTDRVLVMNPSNRLSQERGYGQHLDFRTGGGLVPAREWYR